LTLTMSTASSHRGVLTYVRWRVLIWRMRPGLFAKRPVLDITISPGRSSIFLPRPSWKLILFALRRMPSRCEALMTTQLQGRHAVVTGGSRGIGRAVAAALLAQ